MDLKNIMLIEWSQIQQKYTLSDPIHSNPRKLTGDRNQKFVASLEKIEWKRTKGTFWSDKDIQYFVGEMIIQVYKIVKTHWTQRLTICAFYCMLIIPQLKSNYREIDTFQSFNPVIDCIYWLEIFTLHTF